MSHSHRYYHKAAHKMVCDLCCFCNQSTKGLNRTYGIRRLVVFAMVTLRTHLMMMMIDLRNPTAYDKPREPN